MKSMVQALPYQWLLHLHALVAIEMSNRAVNELKRKRAKK